MIGRRVGRGVGARSAALGEGSVRGQGEVAGSSLLRSERRDHL